ncbi:YdcF family protein [Halomonas sp. FME1]|uniref:YdcF family protein n=1 Tax=Halomonas casei TaxID=2742613 RepID=A0ABR9F318_9GAMM|nr:MULTISPECIES: YdcF family protein [Halomonas]MBE0400162.1 YdcF family protein [Halomonas casei]
MTDFENAQIIWEYMRFEQPLKKADIIIGLGSADVRTAEWSANLYNQGYAPLILFTGSRGRTTREAFTDNEADVYAKRALELDIPDDVMLREINATNTGENIVYAHKLLQEKVIDVKSIILVTKPYMLRRAYATFMKQWPDDIKPDIQCSAIDISLGEYCSDEMYPFDYVANVMVGDLQRIQEYPKLGFQIEQKPPEEVVKAYDTLIKRGYTKHML